MKTFKQKDRQTKVIHMFYITHIQRPKYLLLFVDIYESRCKQKKDIKHISIDFHLYFIFLFFAVGKSLRIFLFFIIISAIVFVAR